MAGIDEARDLLSNSRYAVALFWLPFAALIVTGILHVQPIWELQAACFL